MDLSRKYASQVEYKAFSDAHCLCHIDSFFSLNSLTDVLSKPIASQPKKDKSAIFGGTKKLIDHGNLSLPPSLIPHPPHETKSLRDS